MEIAGELLGVDTDKDIHLFFRRHYVEWFPALSEVHHTTFSRQAANLWKVKEDLWQELLALLPTTLPSHSWIRRPASLPDRHGLFSTHRALLHKENMGQRPLALDQPTASEGPLSHQGLCSIIGRATNLSKTLQATPLRICTSG